MKWLPTPDSPDWRRSPPSRGAWIEISASKSTRFLWTSPPSRGAWIEIADCASVSKAIAVAPLAGGVD